MLEYFAAPDFVGLDTSGLNIFGFFTSWLILWLLFAIPLAAKLEWRPFQPSTAAQKLPLLAVLYLLAPLVLAGLNWLEGKTFADYGMPLQAAILPALAWGLLVGSLGLAGFFMLQVLWGWQRWSPPASVDAVNLSSTRLWSQVLLLLILGLWIGWTEELIFRGFLQDQLQCDLPLGLAATIASLIFAVLHGVWEGKAVLPQLPGLWLMGMVLVLARWVDQGNLGLAWGLHAGWVWTIATLDTFQLLQPTHKVPSWVTGVGGMPLAGLMGFVFLIGTAGWLWWV